MIARSVGEFVVTPEQDLQMRARMSQIVNDKHILAELQAPPIAPPKVKVPPRPPPDPPAKPWG